MEQGSSGQEEQGDEELYFTDDLSREPASQEGESPGVRGQGRRLTEDSQVSCFTTVLSQIRPSPDILFPVSYRERSEHAQ